METRRLPPPGGSQQHEIVVPARFHGPPDTANGGYLVGRMAEHVAADAEVTLRRPAPLDKPLRLTGTADRAILLDGAATVAEARRVGWGLAIPDPVAIGEAAQAQGLGIWESESHPYPTCFVCGPDSADGLRIFPGPLLGRPGQVAAVWTPAEDLVVGDPVAGDSTIAPEFLWAALDCPGYHGARAGDPEMPVRALLGRMSARIEGSASPGVPLVVTGWFIARDGRKIQAGTSLHMSDGTLVAAALTTWIALA